MLGRPFARPSGSPAGPRVSRVRPSVVRQSSSRYRSVAFALPLIAACLTTGCTGSADFIDLGPRTPPPEAPIGEVRIDMTGRWAIEFDSPLPTEIEGLPLQEPLAITVEAAVVNSIDFEGLNGGPNAVVDVQPLADVTVNEADGRNLMLAFDSELEDGTRVSLAVAAATMRPSDGDEVFLAGQLSLQIVQSNGVVFSLLRAMRLDREVSLPATAAADEVARRPIRTIVWREPIAGTERVAAPLDDR